MKYNNLKTVIFSIFGLLIFFGCESFLEVEPLNELSADSAFSSEAGADLFLNDLYVRLPDYEGNFGNDRTQTHGIAWDNWEYFSSFYISRIPFATTVRRSKDRAFTPSSFSGPTGIYNNNFPSVDFRYDVIRQRIRDCNFFIETLTENQSNYSNTFFETRRAEAKFVRAYLYMLIWRAYGGVPLVTEVLNQNEMGDDIFVESSSIREVYEFMSGELAEASASLPNEVGEGHATQGAALALKAYIDLFMGDIARDPRPSAIGAPDIAYATAAYNAAAQACQDIMDLGIYGLLPNYEAVFTEANNNSIESIFAYQHIAETRNSGRSSRFAPFSSWNNTGVSGIGIPTQQLVDKYKMSDGLPISESPLYDPLNPYDNREPRFYQSILYDGANWAGADWTLEGSGAAEALNPPINNRQSTGYARKKGINESLRGPDVSSDAVNFMFFRYAEVLLMYAEAKIKSGNADQMAIDAIDQVRARGGIPTLEFANGVSPLTFSQQQLEDIIFDERAVELAFELKSYWDIIRNRKAGDMLNGPVLGVRRNVSNQYETFNVHGSIWSSDTYYLMPIYIEWLERNPAWPEDPTQPNGRVAGQNPGY